MLCVRIKQARCTCFATQMSPKAVWSRRLRNMQVSLCWWSVNCCVQACKQTQRDTQRRKRVKCAHVGDTNNTENTFIFDSRACEGPWLINVSGYQNSRAFDKRSCSSRITAASTFLTTSSGTSNGFLWYICVRCLPSDRNDVRASIAAPSKPAGSQYFPPCRTGRTSNDPTRRSLVLSCGNHATSGSPQDLGRTPEASDWNFPCFAGIRHTSTCCGAKTQRCPSPTSERTPRYDRSATPLRGWTKVLQEVNLAIDHDLWRTLLPTRQRTGIARASLTMMGARHNWRSFLA